MNNARGFTLIELMIVVLILGILAAVAVPNFVRMAGNARRASCISNQRNMCEAGMIYSAENNFVTGAINVNVLTAAGFITQDVGECPDSGNVDWDDYQITFLDRQITQVRCDIEPARHAYVFVN